MDDEFVLLTSYFNLADGRRQDSADSFRVDPSAESRTSPDGSAALYIVTEASTTGQVGPRARRVAADTVAWEYSTHSDDPPAPRLKAALRAAHEAIENEFDGHVTVGVSVIAIEGNVVYLGQVAPAQVYVLHEDSLNSISAAGDPASPNGRSLGSRSGPRVSVFRDEIGANDVLALCTTTIARAANADELRECFAAGSADEIAESLLGLAKANSVRTATCIVIESVPASELDADELSEPGLTLSEQIDTAVQALTGVGRMLWEELRTLPPPGENHVREPVLVRSEIADEVGTTTHETRAGIRRPDWTAAPRDMTSEVPIVEDFPGQPAPEPGETPGLPEWDTKSSLASRTGESEPATRDNLTEEVPVVRETSDATPEDRDHGLSPNGQHGTLDEAAQAADSPREATRPFAPGTPGVDGDGERTDAFRPRWRRRRSAHPIRRPGAQTGEPDAEETPFQPESTVSSEIDEINARLQTSPEMADVIPPVQAFEDTSTIEPSRIYATSKDIDAVNKRPRRFSGSRPPDGIGSPRVIRPGDSDLDLRRPVARSTPPALVWFSAVAMIVVAAAAVFLYFHHRHGSTVASNPYPSLAMADITDAAHAGTPTDQETYLAKARQRIKQAHLHGASVVTIARLNARYQTTADTIHHVTRLTAPVVLGNFTSIQGAQPSEIAALPGQVLVLDRGRKSVFSVTTTGPSTSGPTEINKSGEIVQAVTVSDPVHIAVDPSNGGTAIILDKQNQIVRYSATAKTATTLTQPTQSSLTPVAIATSDPDVYLLDPANNQVWRYALGVTGYNPTFGAYFDVVKPNLTHAISFDLDGSSMFVLSSDGTVQKFDYQEHPQPFRPTGLQTPLSHPVQIQTLPGSPYVWIADPANGRIVQMDKSGAYVRSYESGARNMDLKQLKSFSIGPAGNTLYVLAGPQVYSFPITH